MKKCISIIIAAGILLIQIPTFAKCVVTGSAVATCRQLKCKYLGIEKNAYTITGKCRKKDQSWEKKESTVSCKRTANVANHDGQLFCSGTPPLK
jgi:hypothetical protein